MKTENKKAIFKLRDFLLNVDNSLVYELIIDYCDSAYFQSLNLEEQDDWMALVGFKWKLFNDQGAEVETLTKFPDVIQDDFSIESEMPTMEELLLKLKAMPPSDFSMVLSDAAHEKLKAPMLGPFVKIPKWAANMEIILRNWIENQENT